MAQPLPNDELLSHYDAVVQVVRIAGLELIRGEAYAQSDDGPFMFGFASMRNTFVPSVGERLATIYAERSASSCGPIPGWRRCSPETMPSGASVAL